jgi:hypothetical protein
LFILLSIFFLTHSVTGWKRSSSKSHNGKTRHRLRLVNAVMPLISSCLVLAL